jgi:hypothetical protein
MSDLNTLEQTQVEKTLKGVFRYDNQTPAVKREVDRRRAIREANKSLDGILDDIAEELDADRRKLGYRYGKRLNARAGSLSDPEAIKALPRKLTQDIRHDLRKGRRKAKRKAKRKKTRERRQAQEREFERTVELDFVRTYLDEDEICDFRTAHQQAITGCALEQIPERGNRVIVKMMLEVKSRHQARVEAEAKAEAERKKRAEARERAEVVKAKACSTTRRQVECLLGGDVPAVVQTTAEVIVERRIAKSDVVSRLIESGIDDDTVELVSHELAASFEDLIFEVCSDLLSQVKLGERMARDEERVEEAYAELLNLAPKRQAQKQRNRIKCLVVKHGFTPEAAAKRALMFVKRDRRKRHRIAA